MMDFMHISFNQVMKIHQEISELVSDRLTDDVIDEYANEVAIKLLKNVIADQNNIGYEMFLLILL